MTSIVFGSYRRDESGVALITAMLVSFVTVTLVAVMFGQVIHNTNSTGRDRRITTAFHIADAGIDQAISALAVNPAFTGTTLDVSAGGGAIGTFSTMVTDPGPGTTNDRKIVSTGQFGASDSRTIRQVVRLTPLGGFDHAIFSASTLSAANNLTAVGSTYSATSTTLQNNTTITGDVMSPSSITTSANSTINGDVWSGGNVTISTGTTVTGNVLATGSAVINGKVTGDVRAASITNNGTIQGQQVIASQPPPASRSLPGFVYNAANYPAPVGPPVDMTAAQFQACWDLSIGCPVGISRTAMRGVFRITDGGPVVGPNLKTTLTGDFYIITGGLLTIQRDFAASGAGPYKMVVISTSTSTTPAAVTWSNNVTNPPNIQTFIYSLGKVQFNNLKSFTGIVYGQSVTADQNFTIAYEPSLRDVLAGFTWNLSSAGAYEIKPMAWHECKTASC